MHYVATVCLFHFNFFSLLGKVLKFKKEKLSHNKKHKNLTNTLTASYLHFHSQSFGFLVWKIKTSEKKTTLSFVINYILDFIYIIYNLSITICNLISLNEIKNLVLLYSSIYLKEIKKFSKEYPLCALKTWWTSF